MHIYVDDKLSIDWSAKPGPDFSVDRITWLALFINSFKSLYYPSRYAQDIWALLLKLTGIKRLRIGFDDDVAMGLKQRRLVLKCILTIPSPKVHVECICDKEIEALPTSHHSGVLTPKQLTDYVEELRSGKEGGLTREEVGSTNCKIFL